MTPAKLPSVDVILDSLNDGLYVCDTDRRIVYWSKSAERITGWSAEDVVGRRCMDNTLSHVDKDGRSLCGKEFCPLHRSMITGQKSTSPVIIFGQKKTGERIPMAVSVAPIRDENGQITGGVETFQDYSENYANLERAKQIQNLSLEFDLPHDSRLSFTSLYLPHDMIGGDYFAISQLDDDHYGFFLADVMGHGVAAALHTMRLNLLWSRYLHTLIHPAEFALKLNRELCKVSKDGSFTTAICGTLHADSKIVRIASAGGPSLMMVHPDGQAELLATSGLPLGLIAGAEYHENEFQCQPGDSLLIFTDGATEIHNASGHMLGRDGLIGILKTLGYPQSEIKIDLLQEALLKFSDGIRLNDDLTLLEIRFS